MDDMSNGRQNHYGSQGKLVLSSHTDGSVPPHSTSDETSFMPAGAPPFAPGGSGYLQGPGGSGYLQGPGGSGYLQGPGGSGYYPQGQPKKGLFQKLRTDPAYQVLAVAIVVVLIASGSLVAFAATGMMGTGSNHGSSNNQQQAKVQAPFTHATPAPTPVPTQAVPTQAPLQTPTPVTQPTQVPPMGNLTVAFNVPPQVNNGTTTQIVVQTQPGAMVQFQVTYPFGAGGPPVVMQQTADNNGMATFNWTANAQPVLGNNNNNVTARLTVAAVNNNGQVARQTANVDVIVNNNGGGK